MNRSDYGDGLPDCPQCHGRGVVDVPPKSGRLIPGLPCTAQCSCVLYREFIRNMERGFPGTYRAPRLPEHSPLVGYEKQNVWVTCPSFSLRSHIRDVALQNRPSWGFLVKSDTELMDAWLGTVTDPEVWDVDVEEIRHHPMPTRCGMLVDLIEPPELLIVLTGVKAARNEAMPEVVLETVQHRKYLDRPTWLVDTPTYPLAASHMAYSEALGRHLEEFVRVSIAAPTAQGLPVRDFTQSAQPHGTLPVEDLSTGKFTSRLDALEEVKKSHEVGRKRVWKEKKRKGREG